MADALCGPSNPLQQFKQQTSLDRTLQQDRLSSRHSPAQGFRSPDPNAGLLDPEFEAFQAGLPASDLPQYQPLHPQQPHFAAGPSQTPSWASDFQRMAISPPPMQQQRHDVSQAGPANADWAQGFRQHIAQSAPRAQHTSSPSPLAFQQRARYGYNGFQSNFAQQQPSFGPSVQSKGKEPVHEQFDEAAFEQAFEMAKDDMMADTEILPGHCEMVRDASMTREQGDALLEKLADKDAPMDDDIRKLIDFNGELKGREFTEHLEAAEEVKTQEAEEQAQQTQAQEDDALAATAQELLEKVEHNQTDKFRNSQFLNLMRKLRDREMKVEGDKMVETVSTNTTANLKPAPPARPTPSPHDSSYASGRSTPMSLDNHHFDTHICNMGGCCEVDHTYDHWESPVY